MSITSLFFLVAIVELAMAFSQTLRSLFKFNLPIFFTCGLMMVMLFVVSIVEIPGKPLWAKGYRNCINSELHCLTKLSCKGLFFVYVSLYLLLVAQSIGQRGFLSLIYYFSSLLGSFVGFIGISIGLKRSIYLEHARKEIEANYNGSFMSVYNDFAREDPQHGLSPEEFSKLCSELSQNQIYFSEIDLVYIYNALDRTQ